MMADMEKIKELKRQLEEAKQTALIVKDLKSKYELSRAPVLFQNTVAVDPSVLNILRRIEKDKPVRMPDQGKITEIRKKIRLHDPVDHRSSPPLPASGGYSLRS